MTKLDKLLAECERLDAAATKGPWEWGECYRLLAPWGTEDRTCNEYADGFGSPTRASIIETDSGFYPPRKGDAAFIAHARTALPRLAKIVAVLREAHEKLIAAPVSLTRIEVDGISDDALAEAEKIAGEGA